MKTPILTSLLAASCILPGCVDDGGKGEEEGPMGAYESKTDSFGNPTVHGDLLFGVPQMAQLRESEGFHAWDFALSDDAKVSLKTLVGTPNLDTVMYLYKFDEAIQTYGHYKFKNDDANGGTVASELVKDLHAGSYRVLVKGFKSQTRGFFEVVANCEGTGCSTASCDLTTFGRLKSDLSDSCGELFSAALDGTLVASNEAEIVLDQRCSLPPVITAAVEDYVQYFGGLDEFNDSFNFGYPGDPVVIEVSWDTYDNGATYVWVDGGADEGSMDYLINGEGQVIAHVQNNQSPDHTLYCDGGTEWLEASECFWAYTGHFPHELGDERTLTATVTPATAAGEVEKTAAMAVKAYADELGLTPDANIEVNATLWDLEGSTTFGTAGRVRVQAAGQEAFVYELEALAKSQFQFTVKRGGADKQYDCVEL